MIKTFSYLLLVIASLAVPVSAAKPNEDWVLLTQAERDFKDVPDHPGAPAVQLYLAKYINEKENSEFFYHRIKVLSDSGTRYANVEITLPFFQRVKLVDLHARTIQPDGRIIEFQGEPYQKTLLKGRRFKFTSLSFTLPEVAVGSVIEYKYKLRYKEAFLRQWLVQGELFTLHEQFNYTFPPDWSVSYDVSPGMSAKPTASKGSYDLEMNSIPPFEAEEQMPPDDKYRWRVRFIPAGVFAINDFYVWQAVAEQIEDFVNPRKEIREEVERAIGAEKDPSMRLRKLYKRAQAIRNLSYERDRTEQESKTESLKRNKNAADVLRHGYGDRDDITLLFVSMARAAGFDASALWVVGREENQYDPKIPALLQANSKIVEVDMNGKLLYLDPGTRFCPFGLIRWMRSGTTAVRLRPNFMDPTSTPAPVPGDFFISRSSDLVLTDDGLLRGTLLVEYRMGEALERRLDSLATDEAGRDRQLEDEVKAWLPTGATVKVDKVDGWEATDTPLTAEFTITVPDFASVAGKRLLVPVSPFIAKPGYAFTPVSRKYPVYFPYTFIEQDSSAILIPKGFAVEHMTKGQQFHPLFAGYEISAQMNGPELLLQRQFAIKQIEFPPAAYPKMREFFMHVHEGDEDRIVLSK